MAYHSLFQALEQAGAGDFAVHLSERLNALLADAVHGDWTRWQDAIDALPDTKPSFIDLVNSVTIGDDADISAEANALMREALQKLHPWRKGPFRLYGIDVDAEWRSNLKWDRLKDHISCLKGRMVLDVGCGNGYYGWRMLGAGARMVVGIDPTLLSVMQFQAVKKLHGDASLYVLPLGIEDIPRDMKLFDSVFSMGVLYHRRSPIDHLLELKGCLRPGGELILETLVIDGDDGRVLLPEQRYAQMRNVWFLPSCETLMAWMRRCGFVNVKLCSVARTTVEEQRSTEWMRFNSLSDFLDLDNSLLTCEGLPAPIRAVFVAEVG